MISGSKLRPIWVALLAVASGVVCPRAGRAQQAPTQPPADTAPATGPATGPALPIMQTLPQQRAVLIDPQTPPELRSEAARRLLGSQSSQARQVLGEALENLNNPAAQLAAARALGEDQAPDPSMINRLFACISPGSSRLLNEAAARALANYRSNADVLNRLIDKAQRQPAQNDNVRREIIKALGLIPERQSAEFMVGLLQNPNESATIREAAGTALVELTGVIENGQDPQKWANWWAQNRGKDAADFRNDLTPRREARYQQVRQQYADLSNSVETTLKESYESAPAAQRPDILLKYLSSGVPEVRAVGARMVRDAVSFGQFWPPAALEHLRNMIGDSSARVRIEVAGALQVINDPPSLEPLLAQLAQERDPAVRGALARALAPIDDLRAVIPLLTMLNDPADTAARNAAEALKGLGRKLREQDPALARRTAEELRVAFERRPIAAGNAELREALLDAMIPLKQEELLPMLRGLLVADRGEPPEIRRLAVKAIGEIGKEQSGEIIRTAMEDKDDRVRLEAVKAMGLIPKAGLYAENLRRRLDENVEKDASVRDAAWSVLQSIFPNLKKEQLQDFADGFANQPERRIFALQALADKLLAEKSLDDLAATLQEIGATYQQLGRFDEAAQAFKQALDYTKQQPNPVPMVINRLIGARVTALLLARQYEAAARFAGECINENISHQPDVGRPIVDEARRLRDANEFEKARKLIDEARKMNPALGEQYILSLTEIANDIEKKMAERNGALPGPGTQPHNALRRPVEVTNTASGR